MPRERQQQLRTRKAKEGLREVKIVLRLGHRPTLVKINPLS